MRLIKDALEPCDTGFAVRVNSARARVIEQRVDAVHNDHRLRIRRTFTEAQSRTMSRDWLGSFPGYIVRLGGVERGLWKDHHRVRINAVSPGSIASHC